MYSVFTYIAIECNIWLISKQSCHLTKPCLLYQESADCPFAYRSETTVNTVSGEFTADTCKKCGCHLVYKD